MAGPSNSESEVELKFLLPAMGGSVVTANPIFARETSESELQSVYYDTPSWHLHMAGLSLRVRRKGTVYVQTVKREAGRTLFDRGEWEHRIGGQEPDPTAWAGTPAQTILGSQNLGAVVPVFATTVQRTSRLLKEGASLVEVSLDCGRIVIGDLHEAIEEVELELKDGPAAGLFVVARRLAAETVPLLSFDSKADRGYRLAAHGAVAAEKARPVHLRDGMSGSEAFMQVTRSCMIQVCSNARRLSETRNPEILHQLRVGLRRLRAAFAAFKLILPDEAAHRLMAEVKWIGSELDPARDIDVFIEVAFHRTKRHESNELASKEFDERLRSTQSASYERAHAAIESRRFAMLLLNCAEWVETGSWRYIKDANVVKLLSGDASALAAEALEHLSKQLRKKGKHLATLKPTGRHRARIKTKKLRYAAEFFDELFGKYGQKRRSKFIIALAELQDALGALNDVTVARRTAHVAAGDNRTLAIRAAQVTRRHDRDEGHLLRKAVQAYARWLRAKPFWH